MLGGGASLVLLGNLIGNNKNSTFGDAGTGVILGGIGVLSMLGSIPVFLASGRNKRKGMSLAFKNETAAQLLRRNFVYKYVPSLSLKISL